MEAIATTETRQLTAPTASMHATVERKALLKVVQGFKVLIQRKPNMPILACVRLTATTSGLDVQGTDIDTHARVRVDCTTIIGGECAVSRQALADAIKAHAGEFVPLRLDGSNLCVGAMTLPTQDVDAFPSMPIANTAGNAEWRFEKHLIGRVDNAVRPVCSTDESRYVLHGIYFNTGNAYATDGHRLHMCPTGLIDGLEGPVLLRSSSWDTMVALTGGGFRLQWNGSLRQREWLVAHGGENDRVRIVARPIDGRYPDVNQVIPQWDGAESSASFNVKALRTALVPHTKIGNTTTRLHMNGTLALSTETPDAGKALNTVECARTGADVTWGASNAYLMEAARALDDGQVELRTRQEEEIVDPKTQAITKQMLYPFELTDGTVRCVVMPMRI